MDAEIGQFSRTPTDSVAAIRHFNRQQIFDAFARFDNDKKGEIALVWDRPLMHQFNVLVNTKELAKNCRVTKNFSLDAPLHVAGGSIRHVVYLITPTNAAVTLLIKHFPQKSVDEVKFSIFFVPESNFVQMERLKAASSIWYHLSGRVHSLPCYWYPDDQVNFAHLGLHELPVRMLFDGDWNYLYRCAKALAQFKRHFLSATNNTDTICGKRRELNFHSKGKWAEQIIDMMLKCTAENENDKLPSFMSSYGPTDSPLFDDIDTVIVIDRWVDLVTSLLTPYTVGGAIDELYGIGVQGITGISKELLSQNVNLDAISWEDEFSTFPFSVADNKLGIMLSGQVYKQLHDVHLINEALRKLIDLEKELKVDRENYKKMQSIADHKNFVSQSLSSYLERGKWIDKFEKIISLLIHCYNNEFFLAALYCEKEILSNSAGIDQVMPFIEVAIAQKRNPYTVLRLIALQSLISPRGLRPQVLDAYRRAFVQSYGIFELNWWLKLQIAGIIREDLSNSHNIQMYPSTIYAPVIKRFRLFNQCYQAFSEMDNDSSYAFNGQGSLLVRYVEEGIADNWRDFPKTKKLFRDNEANSNFQLDAGLVKSGTDESLASESMNISNAIAATASATNTSLGSSLSALGITSALASITTGMSRGETRQKPPRIMLFVVGGVTRAELASLRKLHSESIRFCAATCVITGKSLLDAFRT